MKFKLLAVGAVNSAVDLTNRHRGAASSAYLHFPFWEMGCKVSCMGKAQADS